MNREKGEFVPSCYEFRALKKDGTSFEAELRVGLISYNGEKARQGIIRDIGERKKAVDALRLSKEEFERRVKDRTKELVAITEALKASQSTLRLITDSLPVLINYVDSEQRYRFCNKTYELWRGIPREEIEGRHIKEVLGEAAYEAAREHVEAALSGRPVQYEMAATYQEGGEKHVHVIYVPHLDETGGIKGFAGLITDITERKKMEEALRKSSDELEQRVMERTAEIAAVNEELKMEIVRRKNTEEALRREKDKAERYLDVAGVIIVALDHEGRVILINRKGCEILGYSLHEIIGTSWFDTYVPEADRDGTKAEFFRIIAGDTKAAKYFENSVLTRGGQENLIAWYNTLLTDEDGSIIGTLSSGEDITERKKAEGALRESEERLRSVVSSMDDLLFVLDPSGIFVDGCQLYEKLDLLYLPPEGFLKKHYRDVLPVHVADLLETSLQALTGTDQVQAFDYPMEIGQQTQWFSARVSTLKGAHGHIVGFTVVARIITERKKTEEQVRASLREKEVLLREIHHRVKNNLAVMQSMLRLQSRYAQSTEFSRMLEDAQNRIMSMALAHELLYQSENLTEINISQYLVNLLDQLMGSFSIIGKKIEIRKEIQEVQLGIDMAVPLGFILTELISNCYKHAFPKSRNGAIDVSVKCPGDNKLELVVKDGGVGIPEGMDFEESNSLGYQLIRIFVKQLNGEIRISGQEGTEVRIIFPTR